MRMGSLIAAALLAVLPADADAARRDVQRFPPEDQAYQRYLSTGHIPERQRAEHVNALKFAVPSASRETLLDRQVPQRVGTSNVYRVDLRSLGWDYRDLNKVLKDYPYAYNDPYQPLLTLRADWLVYELADTTESTAYYDLLYGVKTPKTRDEFLKFWGVDKSQQDDLSLGWIETKSQVSKQGTRFIQRFISNRGAAWVTQDVLRIERGSDPLEFPDGVFKHDGEESIAVTPKVSVRLRTRGAAQVYFLSNGEGKRVEEAPVDLVEDSLRTIRKQTAIITNGSCVGCHTKGLNLPSENGIESLILQGVQFYAADKDKQEFAERFHLGTKGLLKEIQRSNEDYATFVEACNGLSAEQNALTYRNVLRDYEAPLNLWRAAYELGATDEELRNALAYATASKIDLGPRFSVLAHGTEIIPRTVFAEGYLKAYALLQRWRER
jgi:hypothetical protein